MRIPSSIRMALVAAIGAAMVSTAVALYVVLRPPPAEDEPEDAVASAAVERPVAKSPAPPVVAPSPATPEAAPPPIAWPDLAVEGLPPVDAAPESMGQSIGSPRDGAMLHASQMPSGRHYVVRNPDTAWATDNTIAHLRRAIASVRRRDPQLHRLVIGDISTRRGGPLSGHTSHQSGRDVDLGLFYRGNAEVISSIFVEGTRDNLDRRATFELIAALAKTRDEPGGVELIVLDYGLQRLLRKAAETRGVPDEQLEALFQFPHGPTARAGLVRHRPAHRDHLHVRFGCPPNDAYCRAPLIGFGGMEATDPTGAHPRTSPPT